jgi:hypothetical protein
MPVWRETIGEPTNAVPDDNPDPERKEDGG